MPLWRPQPTRPPWQPQPRQKPLARLLSSAARDTVARFKLLPVPVNRDTFTRFGLAVLRDTRTRFRQLAAGFRDTPARFKFGDALPVGYYSTTFATNETPISEGGVWWTGARDATDWSNINTSGGNAVGTQSGNDTGTGIGVTPSLYSDSFATIKGTWNRNQFARVRIFGPSDKSDCNTEVEIHLRSTVAPHSVVSYEIEFSVNTNRRYFDLVRWNGQIGDWTRLAHLDTIPMTLATGDIISATVFGNTISAYVNGTLIASVVDTNITTGNPGFGTFLNNLVNSADPTTYGATDFLAEDFQARDTGTRFIVMQARYTPTRLRLVSPIVWRDSASRLRLQSVTVFRETVARFRLTSSLTFRETPTRLRLRSAALFRETASRFRLQSASLFRETATRLRVVSAAVYRDSRVRFVVQQANAAFRDTPSRLKLVSAVVYRETATRLRLQSLSQYRETATRLRLAVSVVTRDTAARFRLTVPGLNFHDTLVRFRLASAQQMLRDSAARFRLAIGVALRDTSVRFGIVSGVYKHTPTRFRLISAAPEQPAIRVLTVRTRSFDLHPIER